MGDMNDDALIVLPGSVYATKTGLIFSNGITFDEWQLVGRKLRDIEACVHFWIGDWLNYGEGKWGEKYSQALEGTGYNYQTLRIDKYVADKVNLFVRTNKLSFDHHLRVAALPSEEQKILLVRAEEEGWTANEMRQRVKEHKREKLLAERSNGGELPSGVALIQGDFRQVMADMPANSVDMIFTDPPYGEEYIHLYKDLAELGARVLKPGGSLITYVGHYAIPQITQMMGDYLRYWWMLVIQQEGQAARLIGKNVFVEYKPMLWYVKEHRRDDVDWVADLIKSPQPEKIVHEWQQHYLEAEYYIHHLTLPGDVVLDPMCGSGTTLIGGYKLKRQMIGIELDSERIRVARLHVQAECGVVDAGQS